MRYLVVNFNLLVLLLDPTKHVEKAKKVIKQAQAKGRPIGTFISEIVVTAAGVVIPSKGYYQELYK